MRNRLLVLDAIVVLAAISVADIAQSAPPPPEQVTRSGPYLVNKTFETESYSLPKTVTRMGEGGVDFPAIVAYLKSINWRGHLNVELDTSPWRPPKESARITANYIRNTLKIEL